MTPLWESIGRRPTPRWLVVHLPAFRVERCGYAADELVVVVAERRNATRIVGLTPAAQAAGLALEMTAAEARALVAGVVIEPLDEQGEAEDRLALVAAFVALGDRVEAGPDDTLVLEVSRCAGWHGGEQGLLKAARALAERFGHRCGLALTDHPTASHALVLAGASRGEGGPFWVPQGDGANALARLPFRALRPSVELAAAVQALGIRTIGAWAKLDPASVVGRYGAEGEALHRVARGLGVPAWTAPVPDVGATDALVRPDEPLGTVEGLNAALSEGLTGLVEAWARRGMAVASLKVRLDLEHGPPERMQLQVGAPTTRVSALLRLLRPRLERLVLSAPVIQLQVEVSELVPAQEAALDLLDRRASSESLPELLARLEDVLGASAVMTPTLEPAWRPERSWRGRSWRAPAVPAVDRDRDDPVAWQEGAAWVEARPRPSRLRALATPIRVEALDVVGVRRPVRLRRERGWHELLRVRGPERLSGEWWQPDGGFERSYWVIELEEGAAWIYEERGQWFLQGWFD